MTAIFHPSMTLAEARVRLSELVVEGCECPCCTQFAKVYKRKIHAGIAWMLIRMYRTGGASEFVYLPALRRGRDGMDQTLAQHWGLTEEEKSRREDGGRVGWWRLTPLGTAFVLCEATVPKYARIYNGHCLGHAGEAVSIIDALGDRFDYRELMDS